MTQVKTTGAAIYTLDTDVRSRLPGSRAQVTLTCLTQTGGVLHELTAGTRGEREEGTRLRHHQSAIVCPADTMQVRVTLSNMGIGEMTYTEVRLRRLAIPEPG